MFVWDPYEITLLSNLSHEIQEHYPFETPMKLHYSQTERMSNKSDEKFETPMKLHYSQTALVSYTYNRGFETPMKLHYSQTTD